jgi:ribose-phosphate pyrophosphokinase
MFPDNTSQVWKLPENTLNTTNYANITWDFQHEGEFMHLAQLKQLLDHNGFTTTLRLKYLPYGRQDKEISNNATFALRTFNKYIDFMNFDEIICNDPHSEVSSQYVRNFKPIYPIEQVLQIAKMTEAVHLCYPDAGALKKYAPLFETMSAIWGEKVRDQLTGNITSYKLVGSCNNQSILIVDDICDGGMTFKLLTKELLEAGAKEVNLFVSHGIYYRW